MNKWFAISLGAILGITHIGMIGLIANRKSMPVINLPTSDYTSYNVEATEDGYTIQYQANDPKVMEVNKDISRPAGFLGFGRVEVQTREEYTMEGARHLESKQGGKLSAAQVECIKAAGGGESTGQLVGGSIGASVATTLTSIPYVGWVLAGAATVMGMEQGGEIGGQMAMDFAECEDIDSMENDE